MTRICHMTSAHPPDDIRIYHKECLSLQKGGYDVTLIVNGKGRFHSEKINVISVSRVRNRLVRIVLSPFIFFVSALKLRASLYHLHDPELLITGFLLRVAGKKVIYDAHEDTSRQILSKYYIKNIVRKPASATIRFLENMAARMLSGVITTSDAIENGFPPSLHSKVTLVRNYPDIAEFSDVSAEINGEAICYVGAMSKSRGIYTILESLPYHNGYVELAGRFYPPSLDETITEEAYQSRVSYHGIVNRQKIKDIYSRCGIGLVVFLPNKHHHVILPIKIFEYMAAGLPVIASDFPLWKEIVDKNKCGFCIEPGNPQLLGTTIEKLLNNDKLRKQMGENGRTAVKEKYNWNSEEKNLLKLYEKILT